MKQRFSNVPVKGLAAPKPAPASAPEPEAAAKPKRRHKKTDDDV